MKKNILQASAAALAALLFLPGCNREAPVSDIADEVRSESIPLWFEGTEGPETRVAIDGTTGAGIWTEGDMIAVWVSGPGANMYQIKAIEDIEVGNESTGHVMISMAADQNRANFAIYPHTAAVEDHHTDSDLYITYPDTYDYSRISPSDLADYTPAPMVAINNPVNHSDPSAPIPPLEFYHVGGVLRITVPNVPIASNRLRFTFPEGLKFSGTFKVTEGGTPNAALTAVGEDHSNVITVLISPGNYGSITLNIPIPATDYTSANRDYKIEALDLETNTPFMATDEVLNWKAVSRSEGKKITTFSLRWLGTFRGKYLTRGYLKRPNVIGLRVA